MHAVMERSIMSKMFFQEFTNPWSHPKQRVRWIYDWFAFWTLNKSLGSHDFSPSGRSSDLSGLGASCALTTWGCPTAWRKMRMDYEFFFNMYQVPKRRKLAWVCQVKICSNHVLRPLWILVKWQRSKSHAFAWCAQTTCAQKKCDAHHEHLADDTALMHCKLLKSLCGIWYHVGWN